MNKFNYTKAFTFIMIYWIAFSAIYLLLFGINGGSAKVLLFCLVMAIVLTLAPGYISRAIGRKR